MNFRKVYFETDEALKPCIEKIPTKNKLQTSQLTPWNESILTKVKENIENLKHSKATRSIEKIIQANTNYCKRFDLIITELDKTLPI